MLEILILYLQATFKNSFPAIQDVHGLAEQVRNGNKTFPSLYCTNDEYQPLSGNENFLYFRQLGAATEAESDEESVSGCDHYVTRTYPMVAIAYIPKNIFNTDNAFIDSKIAGNIANILRVANYGTLMASMKVEDIHAEVTRISTDRYEVWEQEFKGIDIAARFDHVLCAVEFDLIVSATERCLQNYDCNDETVTVEGDTIIVEISDSNAWHKDGDFLTEIKQIGSTNAVNWQLIHGGMVKATVTADGLNIPAIVGDVAITGNLVVTGSIDYTTGAIQSLNGLTAKSQVFAVGSSGTDFNIVSAGSTHTINIPDASALNRGLVTTGAQTFAGVKTFASAPILTGFTQGSVLFAGVGGVITQDNANLFWDDSSNGLYIGAKTSALFRQLNIVSDGGFASTGWSSYSNSGSVFIDGRRARGSVAAPSQLLSGDTILTFAASSYHSGGAFSLSNATISIFAAENQTASAQGTAIAFNTVINGGTTRTEAFRVSGLGNFLVGNTSGTAKFQVRGNLNGIVFLAETSTQQSIIQARETAGARQLGFYGNTPVSRQTINAGSTAAILAEVVTALENLGLIIDNT